MKRALVIGGLILATSGGMAAIPDSSLSVKPYPEVRSSKQEYVSQVEKRLSDWEQRISLFKQWYEREDNSSPQAKAVDDLELELRDIRGDVDELKLLTRDSAGPMKRQIEAKLDDVAETFHQAGLDKILDSPQ